MEIRLFHVLTNYYLNHIQAGIEKLESWQSTVWGYWETIKGFGSGGSKMLVNAAKKAVAERLKTYK